MRDLPTKQLVALVQSTGDRRAFDILFERYGARLHAFLVSRTGSHDVDDLMQDTFVKAFLNIRKFKGNAEFSTWLFRIALNEFFQSVRRRGALDWLKAMLGYQLKDADTAVSDIEHMIDLEKALGRLTERQREVFILFRVYGYSHAEIASKLKTPLGSVKTYIRQANRILEEWER